MDGQVVPRNHLLSAGRLIDLARDWRLYSEMIPDPEWCDEMRQAVVVEMRYEVDLLAETCGALNG